MIDLNDLLQDSLPVYRCSHSLCHKLIHLFNKYLSSTKYMPGTFPGTGDTAVIKIEKPCLCAANILGQQLDEWTLLYVR